MGSPRAKGASGTAKKTNPRARAPKRNLVAIEAHAPERVGTEELLHALELPRAACLPVVLHHVVTLDMQQLLHLGRAVGRRAARRRGGEVGGGKGCGGEACKACTDDVHRARAHRAALLPRLGRVPGGSPM